MAFEFEGGLRMNHSLNEVDGLHDYLVDFLVHAHLYQLVESWLKTFFLAVYRRDVVDDFFKGRLS